MAWLAVLCSSCTDNGPRTVVGRWMLQTIDAQSLPQPFDATTTIHSDEIVVAADGSFDQFRLRAANGATPAVQEYFGNWSQDGDQVTFTTTTGGTQETFTVAWSGDTQFIRARLGKQWIYRKE